MINKRPLFATAATLLITCFVAGKAAAQNFRVDIGGTIHRSDTIAAEGALSAFEDEVTFSLSDSPGVTTSPGAVIPGGDGEEDVYPTLGGILAYANDRGSFRAHLAGGIGETGKPVENQVLLTWNRDFVKADEATPFHFIVNPGLLRIVDSRGTPVATNEELEASWRLTAKVEGITQFDTYKRLHGKGSFSSQIQAVRNIEFRNHYRMTDDTGPLSGELKLIGEELDVPDGKLWTYIGGQYKTPAFQGMLDLTGVGVGETFTVTYTLTAHTLSFGSDTLAESMSGDPLKYIGGVLTEYGNYGEVLRITDFVIDEQGRSRVQYPSDPVYYYILCRGDDVSGIEPPVALKAGEDGTGELMDERPADQQQRAFYLVKRVHSSAPLDSDGDGIDDVYELNRPAILDPLNPADALLDADGDGRNALQEYIEGTDPETPDEAPGGDDLYPAATFAIGEGGDLESADLNNDGIVDLISFNSATLYVSFGNADGTFAPPITVAIPDGGFIGDITLSDLNGDGFPDVVFADGFNNRVEVLFGDGSGGFVSDAKYDLGETPRHAVLAHVNNDAHLDIITIHNSSRSVAVLIGNGDGTFQAPTTIDTTDRPTDATAALMNDDLHPDLIITLESGGSRVAVLLNNGDGTFADPVTYATGTAPQRVATGDVDGDGMADIITSNGSGNPANGVSVLLGNGDGTLQANVDYPTGASPRGLLLRDMDGDGDLDLLVAHVGNEANHHAILFNDGSGDFSELEIVPTSSGNQNVLLVDVDRDGLPDIISRVLTSQAMVTHGLPGGGFDTRVQINFDRGFSPRDFEVADVNADGRPDIVIANGGNFQTVEILLNQGAGEFAKLPPLSIGEQVQGLALARFDAGPTLDLAVVTQRPEFSPGNSSNQLHVLRGDGTGAFTVAQVVDLHAPPTELLAGDFNGDGDVDGRDLVIGYNVTGEVQLFINTGTEFEARTPVKVGEFFNRGVVGDFDGDGITDIAAVVWDGQAVIKVLRGATDGVLTESQVITPLDNGQAQRLAVSDVNSNGLPDLLVTVVNGDMRNLVFYPGTEEGNFGAEQLLIDGFSGDVFMVDLNQDGLPDLLSGSTIRLAEAGGGFGPPRTYYLPVGAFATSVIVADMDGDSRPDMVAADTLGNAVNILLHR
jgi:hypothetical protein